MVEVSGSSPDRPTIYQTIRTKNPSMRRLLIITLITAIIAQQKIGLCAAYP